MDDAIKKFEERNPLFAYDHVCGLSRTAQGRKELSENGCPKQRPDPWGEPTDCFECQEYYFIIEQMHEMKTIKKKLEGNYFAFTKTYEKDPHPKPHRQYEITIDDIMKVLHRCSKDWWIIPELTKSGRIHYHGWLRIDDKIKFYKQTYPFLKSDGFVKTVELETQKDMHDWMWYCTKDENTNKIIFSDKKKPREIVETSYKYQDRLDRQKKLNKECKKNQKGFDKLVPHWDSAGNFIVP